MEQNTTEPESDSSSVVPTEDAVESEPNNGEPEGIRAGPSSSEPPVVNSDACDAMPPAQPNDSDAGINKDVAINSSEVVDEAAIDLSMEDPVPASAPMEDSLPASAPMEDSLPASAPMEDPVLASVEDPVPASAPVEDSLPASAPMEDPVPAPASVEDSLPASAPMEDPVPASAPMEDSLPASAPMEDPVPASAPMEDPVPASAPVEDPVPASASVEDPVSTPAAMTGSIIPANEDEEEEPFFSLPSPLIQALIILWLLWLFVGTCFYAYELNMGWATGFYMAVNIGYSIGWGDFSEGPSSQWFSIFYVICGSSFVAAALGIFANNIISESGRWYENELKQVAFDHVMAKPDHYPLKLKTFVMFHWTKLRTVLLFTSFILIATLCAWQNTKFTFREALYFAVASLSTGGHYALPSGQDDWVYGMTGFYAALGVPVMGVAMGTMAGFFIASGTVEETLFEIRKPVNRREVKMLTEFGKNRVENEMLCFFDFLNMFFTSFVVL